MLISSIFYYCQVVFYPTKDKFHCFELLFFNFCIITFYPWTGLKYSALVKSSIKLFTFKEFHVSMEIDTIWFSSTESPQENFHNSFIFCSKCALMKWKFSGHLTLHQMMKFSFYFGEPDKK